MPLHATVCGRLEPVRRDFPRPARGWPRIRGANIACTRSSPRPRLAHNQIAQDDTLLDDAGRARWRRQALEWIRAERGSCARLLADRLPVQSARARKTLEILLHHRGLEPVRDPRVLEALPEDEHTAWRELWSEVTTMLSTAL